MDERGANKRILVTGGAGFIGSHTCVELLAAGHDLVVVDNLDNSCEEALRRVVELAGRELEFHRVDICDDDALRDVFARAQVDAVIHTIVVIVWICVIAYTIIICIQLL